MRRAVVTGAAGFIGSHLCERLIAEGWSVTGIDAFTDYYDRADKVGNLAVLEGATTSRRWTSARCSRACRSSSTSPPSPACA